MIHPSTQNARPYNLSDKSVIIIYYSLGYLILCGSGSGKIRYMNCEL